ncbi:hypothetical protein [Ekhidna sp.]
MDFGILLNQALKNGIEATHFEIEVIESESAEFLVPFFLQGQKETKTPSQNQSSQPTC